MDQNPYQSPREIGINASLPRSTPPMRFRLRTLALVLGFIPLLFYPVVAMADFMCLADAPRTPGDEPIDILDIAFLVGSLAYPVVYCLCDLIADGLVQESNSEL